MSSDLGITRMATPTQVVLSKEVEELVTKIAKQNYESNSKTIEYLLRRQLGLKIE